MVRGSLIDEGAKEEEVENLQGSSYPDCKLEASSPNNGHPLDWLSVAGFKSIKRLEKLPMRRINVVIGANGSGKSNLLSVFSFLEASRAGRLSEYVARAGGADRMLHFGAKTTDMLDVEASFGDAANRYRITLVPGESDRLVPLSELWSQSRRDSWRLYHFHDTGPRSPIKRVCPLHDNRFLRADGSNLAAFLHLLHKRHEESYNLIRGTIRLAAPFFDDFVLEPMAINEDMIQLEWRHVGTDAYFDVSSLSDGTLRFMAMATLLLQPAQLLPSVILVDEPELGLHPYAITLLCSLVKAASVKTQVIIATQSSLILDHFEPEDVLVAERREGASTFVRLSTLDLEAWLQDYSLGQLWEKNEIGGRPSVETQRTR